MPAKRQYPNLPSEFRHLVREARLKQGLTMRTMAADLGTFAAQISQFEKGQRNFNYENAVQYRDYLKMKYDLPLPRPEEAEPITRTRKTKAVEKKEFYICVDGEILQVLSYRRIGKVTDHQPCVIQST